MTLIPDPKDAAPASFQNNYVGVGVDLGRSVLTIFATLPAIKIVCLYRLTKTFHDGTDHETADMAVNPKHCWLINGFTDRR